MVLLAFKRPDPITVASMIAHLKPNRDAFTGLAYQYFAICGTGSNDVGGSNDCSEEDAVGLLPHLAKGHPTPVAADLGAQLSAGLGTGLNGSPLELWPVISYGNPGNASVLNRLLNSNAATQAFINDAVKTAHAQKLTGFNFDLETAGMSANLTTFLQKFTVAMHAANPRIGVSYDAGNTPLSSQILMDRWISMGTYTSSLPDFISGLAEGIKSSGTAFGVGLCPICYAASPDSTKARFDAIATYGAEVREIDLWAADYTGAFNASWDTYWPHLKTFLE